MKIYNRFRGKICTILTKQSNLPNITATQHADYFTGVVAEVDEHGILIKHVNTNTHAFYPFPIIGIVEEQVIPEDDPNFGKIKEEIEKKNSRQIPTPKPVNNNLVTVEEMTRMAQKAISKSK